MRVYRLARSLPVHGSASINLYLCCMRKKMAILTLTLWCGFIINAQTSYIGRSDLMALADSCLKHTYNFSFKEARQYQKQLAGLTPGHPAPDFLEALIIYWEYFPLTPEDEASARFVGLMDKSIALAKEMIENEGTHLEGVFFDLFGRAFKAMFWADNGKPGKVVPDLRTMYLHTKEGFQLKDDFAEFYFSTGLYNYYIEAYPEAHPVYKPLVAFMQDGDRQLGLTQLNYAINHTLYLKEESLLFMSLIQLKYENDLKTAAIYAERLHREYPRNIYYQGHLITILLHQHRYDRAREVVSEMRDQQDTYSLMIRQLAEAFQDEKEAGNVTVPEKKYQDVIRLADSIGPFADIYKAMGLMGLSRLYAKKGLTSESNKYARQASNYTVYRFILDERQAFQK
jgi:hypothetical protein